MWVINVNDFIKVQEGKIFDAIKSLNYDVNQVKLNVSSMPELGDYQFNGVMALAKEYKKNPREIAQEIVDKLDKSDIDKISVDGPGFINIRFKDESLIKYFNNYELKEYNKNNKTIIIDYGGANVAKALHVGHLRSANIGEALKRLALFLGYDVKGDAHLGDYGRPLGLVIKEIQEEYPDLEYFNPEFNGNYDDINLPITNADLERLYPLASNKAKEDESYLEDARVITTKFQNHEKGYYELWQRIIDISKKEIKKLYDKLNVSFEIWNGESDEMEYFDKLLKIYEDKKLIEESEGAKVINVTKENETSPMPPLLMVKTNGSMSYDSTDLAAILERKENFNPNEIWYVVDNRQSLHFEQVFRAARLAKLVSDDVVLDHINFGTMNGKDGKPFKTRDGGVMTLESLIDLVKEEVSKKINENYSEEEKEELSNILSIAALKYADLLPVRETDYVFDVEKFCDLNGKTGIYLLYSIVRANSLLNKSNDSKELIKINKTQDREILIKLLQVDSVLYKSFEERSLNFITDYLYQLSKTFNSFYDSNKVLVEKDDDLRKSWIYITSLYSQVATILTNILAIEIPNKM